MRCEAVREWLFDYVDGRLDPDRVAQVEAELARCDQCRSDHADILAMNEAAARWQDESAPVTLGYGLPDRLPRRLGERPAANDPWRWIPVAACAVLAVVVLLDMGGSGGTTPEFPVTALADQGLVNRSNATTMTSGLVSRRELPVTAGGAVAVPVATGTLAGEPESTGIGDASVFYLLIREELERQQDIADQAFGRLLQMQLSQEQRLNALASEVRALSLTAIADGDGEDAATQAASEPAETAGTDAGGQASSEAASRPMSDDAAATEASPRGFQL